MMFYKNTIVTKILLEDTLRPYLFMIILYYVLQTSIDRLKENGFLLKKDKSRLYLGKAIKTDANNFDNIPPLTNAHVQAKFLMDCLEQTAGGTNHYVNEKKKRVHVF